MRDDLAPERLALRIAAVEEFERRIAACEATTKRINRFWDWCGPALLVVLLALALRLWWP